MSSLVNVAVYEIEMQITQARAAISLLEREAPKVIPWLVSDAFALLPPVPKFVENEISDELIERVIAAGNYAKKLLAVDAELAHKLGNPDRLRASAKAIGEDVSTRAGDLATDVRPNSLTAMSNRDQWDSEASDMYAKDFIGQSEAVLAIQAFSKPLEAALSGLANEIEQFYASLLGAVAGLALAIAGFVVAIVAACTVVLVPAAVAAAGVAGLAAEVAVGQFGVIFMTEVQNLSDSVRTLSTKLKPWPTAHFAS